MVIMYVYLPLPQLHSSMRSADERELKGAGGKERREKEELMIVRTQAYSPPSASSPYCSPFTARTNFTRPITRASMSDWG
jgi:hypothetical protein